MEKRPLVSIITPTYNHEKFIGQCIESVLAQTYENWEQIIIDDGSTDGTEEIVAQYDDDRIKYVRQEHIGIWRLNETYNKALKISKGQLIAILEGDDLWPPYKLERQVPIFEIPRVILSWGKAAVIDDNKRIISTTHKRMKFFNNDDIIKILLKQNIIPACTVMCRKDVLLNSGGFKQIKNVPYVDYPTWLKLSLLGEFKFINDILGYWRLHDSQISSTIPIRMQYAHNKCLLEFWKSLPQEYINLLKLTKKDIIKYFHHNLAEGYFFSGRLDLKKKEWKSARYKFNVSYNKGTLWTKLKALSGIVCSYLKLDLDWFSYYYKFIKR